jgi:N-acetylmuramoyl-L-alanine amidase
MVGLTAVMAMAAALAAGPLDGRTVVLDPGHNGRNGAHPERINRQVHVGGGMYKACNTTGTATASGYAESTRIGGLTDDIHRPSRRLGRRLRAAYEHRTGLPRADYVGGDGLVARSDLGGLRLADVPAVFIETLNMRNAADARKAESPRFRRRIARGIADGIRDFLG